MSWMRIIFVFLALFLCLHSGAQKASIRATVDKNRILIGEPLNLTVEARIPVNSRLRLTLPDSLPHFEKAAEVKVDSVKEGSSIAIRAQYQLTSFDSGHWVIPAFVLARGVSTDTLGIDVVFSDFDPKQPYHDMRDIIPVAEEEKQEKQWWYFVAAGLVLVAFVLYLVFRKKPAIPAKITPPVDPYDNAKKQLLDLQRQKPGTKEYYSRLTDIFRVYVGEKKNIHSLQHTTDDLVLQLRSLYPGNAIFEKLAQALRLADFVKFAKYVPGAEDDSMAFDSVSRAIDEIERKPDVV